MIKSLVMFLLLVGALFLVFRITGWKMKKAADFILADLKKAEAFSPESAIELPYGKEEFLRVGMRDYRPKTLAALTSQNVVRMIEGRKYYIREEFMHTVFGQPASKEHPAGK